MISWFRRAFPQEAFRNDWYGWFTNQVGHIALGFVLAWAVSIIWFGMVGEMPYKVIAWPVCLGIYVVFEIARGWTGWDSFEDTIFASLYGSGGAFFLFTESTIGSLNLSFDMKSVLPAIGVIGAHLAYGIRTRLPHE